MKTQITVLIVTSLITLLIRALPFFFGDKFKNSQFLRKFSNVLTPALIGMLVVYCLKDISFQDNSGLASLICVGLCIITYIWKRKALLSIVIPTIVYMIMINCL